MPPFGLIEIGLLVKRKLEEGLSPRTVQLSLVALRRALGQAVKNGLIPRKVAKLIDGPRVTRIERKNLSPDELEFS